MKTTRGSLLGLAVASIFCGSLAVGCTGTSVQPAGATPGGGVVASASPGAAAATPSQAVVSEVTKGDGTATDGAGGINAELKVWGDKFDGTPYGRGTMTMMLVPGASPLPGLESALTGMQQGGVKRVEMTAKDLFGKSPEGASIKPDQKFFIELKVLDVYPTEDFDITTVTPGTGDRVAKPGDALKVHYVGRTGGFDKGGVFDSSRERDQPFVLKLGEGQVIPGWEKGLEGMKKGEVRRLSIPHYLAYGDKAQGDKIPAKSRLFFEVELLDFVQPGELVAKVTKPGKGTAIAAGQVGKFHYTGWSDGFEGKQKFDSSYDRKEPISVKLGAGQVIQGWDQGLVGMKPGEKKRLEIPYNLGYGEGGKPPSIPPYATLYFEVEYVGPGE